MIRNIALVSILLLTSVQFTLAQTTQPDSGAIARTELFRRSENAIARGVKFELSRQNTDGSWTADTATNDRTGSTALVTLSLLYCGESHQSPALQKAITFLKRSQPQNLLTATYSIALRASVYATLPEALRKQELPADLRWLQQAMIKAGPNRGMYDYRIGPTLGGDFSNSQYGVLGVWYAEQSGLEVPRAYWKSIEDGWRAGENADGGWGYRPRTGNSYASMTAAAAATLFITNDYLHSGESQDLSHPVVNKPLDDAIRWLGDNFSPDQNSGHDTAVRRRRPDQEVQDLLGDVAQPSGYRIPYMLFGYERVGEASGLTRLGDHKWFDEGADFLIRTQAYDGSWSGTDGSEIDSAYALLFLTRGRAPIVVQKLSFEGRWNNRPRDISGLTHFLRRASERHVNWQVVASSATPGELREAPLLYLASDRSLDFTDELTSRIKTYIDQGGLLICVNEGGSADFVRSVNTLARQMYPQYAFRELPPNHPIFTANFPVTRPPAIRGLSNGLRELIVFFPSGDQSWKWQLAGGGFEPRNTPYAPLANLWLYVTDRANPRFKGEDTWVEANPGTATNRSGTVARIRHDGNWDPEPGGWQRLTNVMHNFDQFDLKVTATTDPTGFSLAHLTDTASLRLSKPAQMALKQYTDAGGLLLIDAAAGSSEAAGSIDPLLHQMYPDVIIAPLPLEHPIYHGQGFGGEEIRQVQYRRSENLQPTRIPRLRGATVGGKLVAIVSYEDLSGALVGYSTAGLAGYTPSSATEIVRNIILWRNQSPK